MISFLHNYQHLLNESQAVVLDFNLTQTQVNPRHSLTTYQATTTPHTTHLLMLAKSYLMDKGLADWQNKTISPVLLFLQQKHSTLLHTPLQADSPAAFSLSPEMTRGYQ